mmetsp:Transcript_19863/g.62903  ORF Transcript_19863/g.62903 Transcript_19863/m.62903 type:complete len:266 (-) Transcript_19863:3123-3920(-)
MSFSSLPATWPARSRESSEARCAASSHMTVTALAHSARMTRVRQAPPAPSSERVSAAASSIVAVWEQRHHEAASTPSTLRAERAARASARMGMASPSAADEIAAEAALARLSCAACVCTATDWLRTSGAGAARSDWPEAPSRNSTCPSPGGASVAGGGAPPCPWADVAPSAAWASSSLSASARGAMPSPPDNRLDPAVASRERRATRVLNRLSTRPLSPPKAPSPGSRASLPSASPRGCSAPPASTRVSRESEKASSAIAAWSRE